MGSEFAVPGISAGGDFAQHKQYKYILSVLLLRKSESTSWEASIHVDEQWELRIHFFNRCAIRTKTRVRPLSRENPTKNTVRVELERNRFIVHVPGTTGHPVPGSTWYLVPDNARLGSAHARNYRGCSTANRDRRCDSTARGYVRTYIYIYNKRKSSVRAKRKHWVESDSINHQQRLSSGT